MALALEALRQQLATLIRSDDNRDAQGRFAAGGGGDKRLGFVWGHAPELSLAQMTPAQRELAQRADDPHGIAHQCAACTKMTTGPLKGTRLGFRPTMPWSDGLCPDCHRRKLVAYFRSRGLSAKAARAKVNALIRASTPSAELQALSDNPKMYERMAESERAVDLLVLRARFARLQQPEAIRRGTPVFGAHHRIIGNIGEDGVFHPAGSVTKVHVRDALALHEPGSHVHAALSAYLTKSSAMKAPSVADLHATAARLHVEQGLPKEVQPGEARQKPDTQTVAQLQAKYGQREVNPAAPLNLQLIKDAYGERQLGMSLTVFSREKLFEAAQQEHIPGIKANMPKAELVSRITAHVTGGRYSANFARQPAGTAKAKTPATSDPRRDAYLRDLGALREKHAAYLAAHPEVEADLRRHEAKAGRTAGTKSSGKRTASQIIEQQQSTLKPIKTGINYEFDPFAPPDARFLNELYGKEQLPTALARYTQDRLKEAAANLGIAPGKTKEDSIARIYEKVTGERMPGAKSAGSAKTTTPYVGNLRSLNDSSDPLEAWRVFGGSRDKFFAFLNKENQAPLGALEKMLRSPNMPPGNPPRGKSRAALARNIADRVAAAMENQRATTPNLARIQASFARILSR